MDRDTPTTAPVTMHAVVITKPGYDTVRFGPLSKNMADEWATRLRGTFHNRAHPEGTTVNIAVCDPQTGYIHPDTIPGNVDDLMEPFRADHGYTDEGYPGIHTRLIMRWGWMRANELWDQACRLGSAEDAVNEAEAGIKDAAAEAADLVAEAYTAAQRAYHQLAGMLADARRFELDVPGDRNPEDAVAHLAAVLLGLRAAGRVLRPTGKD